jgi:hypothetical protein
MLNPEFRTTQISDATTLAPLSTVDHKTVIACRKLVADRYLSLGYYDSTDVSEENIPLPERWDSLSDYYSVPGDISEGEPRATCRVIRLDQYSEPMLPLLAHFGSLDTEARKEILYYMDPKDPYSVVEISALARSGGIKDDSSMEALTLYSKMFQDFLYRSREPKHDRELWIMAVSPALMNIFKSCFGEGVISQAGQPLPYKGEETIPCILDPKKGIDELLDNGIRGIGDDDTDTAGLRLFIAESLIEGHEQYLSHDTQDKLGRLRSMLNSESAEEQPDGPESCIEGVEDASRKSRRKKELIASALLIGYTAFRTLVVKSDMPSADWRVFLGIELATTYPYVKGISNYLKYIKTENQDKRLATINMAMAVGSFMFPYLYVYKRPVEAFQSSPVGSATFCLMALYGVRQLIKSADKNKNRVADNKNLEFTD